MALRSSHPLDRIATIAASGRGRGSHAEGARPADVLEIGRSIGEFWSVGVKNWSIFKDLGHSAAILGSPPSCPSTLRSASSGGVLPEHTTQRVIRWRLAQARYAARHPVALLLSSPLGLMPLTPLPPRLPGPAWRAFAPSPARP
jgi:hypothetical protein